jgi:ubiquinone/menaquinone biosynthesis C-methylase UbiE
MNLITPWAHPRGLLGRLAGWEMAHGKERLNRAVLHLLAPGPDDRILEVGFGPGATLAYLSSALPGARLAGADPSQVMHAQASRRVHADLRLAAAEQLPFADAEFDRALTLNSFAHWSRPRDGLAELRRVLRAGGRLVVGLRGPDALEALNADLDAAGFAVQRVIERPTLVVAGV